MRVIICGAGQVGINIARYLSQFDTDITIIDLNEGLVRDALDTLDVQGIVGHASNPDILRQAGADDADLIVAVTQVDEINMIACQVAHSLFQVPTKVARIRQTSFLKSQYNELFANEHLPIDHIIAPEAEVAKAIMRRLRLPGVSDVIPINEDEVFAASIRTLPDTPILGTPLNHLAELFPGLNMTLATIVRDGSAFVPDRLTMLEPHDEVYVVAPKSSQQQILDVFGHRETEGRRVMIVGAGNIGMNLARMIEDESPHVRVKMVELDPARARVAAERLPRAQILHGDSLDNDLLLEAGIGNVETVVAVTNEDEVNILVSLLAKRMGAERAVTLVNRPSFGPLVGQLGIDAPLSPRMITVSSILEHVRQGQILSVYGIADGFGELYEIIAPDRSPVVGKTLRDAKLPDGVVVVGVLRPVIGDDGEEHMEFEAPRGGTIIQAGERVIFFVAAGMVKKAQRLFSVGVAK